MGKLGGMETTATPFPQCDIQSALMRISPTTQFADNIWDDGSSYLYSQTTRRVENAILYT
jgi:hypothetical protein